MRLIQGETVEVTDVIENETNFGVRKYLTTEFSGLLCFLVENWTPVGFIEKLYQTQSGYFESIGQPTISVRGDFA